MTLLHVMSAAAWARLQADGAWPASPFWHLCTTAQLPFVLELHFAGQGGLVVLHMAASPEIRWEVSEPGMEPFPHLYGPLRADAVSRVVPA